MKPIRRIAPYGLVIGWSLLVHLPGITSPLLDYHAYRQCQTASMARNYARHGMHFLQPELDTEGRPRRAGTEFPLYSYLLAILFKLFGNHDILGRLLSSVFAAWGALFLYGLVRRRLGERVALWGALVMCALPIHVYFTRSVQPEPMALWGLLGFLYYLDNALLEGGSLNWALALLFGSVAPLLKLPFLYVVVPLGCYMAWERRGGQVLHRLSFLAVMGGLMGLTAAWYHYAKTSPVGILPLSASEQWRNLRASLSPDLWRNHFISRLPELCLTYPGLLFGIVGVWAIRTRKVPSPLAGEAATLQAASPAVWRGEDGGASSRTPHLNLPPQGGRSDIFWYVWFAVTALYIILLGEYGLIHRYTELPFAPIDAVFIASGILFIWEKGKDTPWLRLTAVVLVVGIPVHTAFRIAHWYRLEYPWVFRARNVVAQVSRPDELIITNTREHPVLLYYLDRYGFAPDLEETGLGVIDAYRAQGARFFLTPTAESWSHHPEWSAYFEKNARLLHRDPEYLLYQFNH